MLATYICSICDSVIPDRKHCEIEAVGYNTTFDGFALLGKCGYACEDCVTPPFENCLNRQFFTDNQTCNFCNKGKTKHVTRLRLHIPDRIAKLFPNDHPFYGCFKCVGMNLIEILNEHFNESSVRIGCPDCKQSKGSKTLLLAKIVKMGSMSHGDMFFTCRTCFERKLNWKPG